MNKKIVIASNTSWFVKNFFSSSIVEFMKNNNQVYIVAPRDNYTEKLIELGCHYREVAVDRSGVNPLKELKTLIGLWSIYRDLKPDCVLNFTPKINIYSVLVCKLLGIKVVNSVAGLGSIISETGFKSWIGKLSFRLTQPLADHVIFQNNEDKSIYLSHGFAKKNKSSRVNGIGINLKQFVPQTSSDDGTVRFILYARMLKNKGVVDYVHAVEKVHEHFLLLNSAGKVIPCYEFSLLGFVDEANPQGLPKSLLDHWNNNSIVSYLGETDDVMSIVKDYDCVVLPSYYREGIPHCLIESCAMAKPIITTNNVGCRETVINNVSGYIVEPKCVPDLSDAIIRMIQLTHQQRLKMGEQGRKKAEQDFCHIQISKHYMGVIRNIIDGENIN
ncbi:glycosyltransferase family 4 protein [Vibrio sp. F13]|uniref:glycosyltransferase family 4 protein n=1 Tax=Vibrio sp. F13 TaxID=2070777 RepID=UPI0010BDDC3C|nr:glycosyltransferase family 4 protein [Vibrio sp. F13]TKF67354.1 glycosyltransferase family 4 protein [Vibrio sp. F13]